MEDPPQANARLMIDLLRAIYWYDEALQAALQNHGWPMVTRTQSLLFANIAMGETRPAHLARNLGITRQSMSQLLAGLVARQLLIMVPDPDDRRAQIVKFTPESQPLRAAAGAAMAAIQQELARRIGQESVDHLRDILHLDWGTSPDVSVPRSNHVAVGTGLASKRRPKAN